MNKLSKQHWPLFSVMGLYWVTILVLIMLSVNMNQGHLVYPIDDTYIHMSIAKNAAIHHVWGVTKYEFTSSTSSPLWTFLLFITYLVFGVSETSPLILNLLCGSLAISASYLFLKKYISSQLRTFGILLTTVFITPLPSITLTGMEHVLHALLSLCFVYFSIQTLNTNNKTLQKHFWLALALSPLITMIRYEGMFMVFVVCVLLLLQKRPFSALTLGITAMLPVIGYGVWSISHGWYFFPNSLLMKASIPRSILHGIIKLSGFGVFESIKSNRKILIFLISSFCLLLIPFLDKEKFRQDIKNANLIIFGCLLFHLQFASTGWFFRYEAYLVLLGAVIISITVNDMLTEKFSLSSKIGAMHYALAIFLILVIGGSLGYRAIQALYITPRATNNIYEQQYQMGTFIKKFYQGKTIAVNDIGAVSYLADIQLFDLWGLGSLDPANLILQGNYNTLHLQDLLRQRNAKIAIVYDDWFESKGIGRLPEQWVKAGQWKISDNVIAGFNTVSLYAVDPTAGDELLQNLRQFAKELPAGVKQYGKYLEKEN